MNARRGSAILFLFSFSHYILNDVATSNCKAMISMIKATCFFLQYGDENICEVYRVLIGAACRRCDVVHHHPSTTSYGAYSTVDCSVRVLNVLCCHISTSWSTCAVPNMAVFVPAVCAAQVHSEWLWDGSCCPCCDWYLFLYIPLALYICCKIFSAQILITYYLLTYSMVQSPSWES
jgi:hypothetical protein